MNSNNTVDPLELANAFCQHHSKEPFFIDTICSECKVDSNIAYKVARAGVKSGVFTYGDDSLSFIISNLQQNMRHSGANRTTA